MAQTKPQRPLYAPHYTGPRFLGAPIGDFSVLQTLLITGATGVASFFAATFVAIMSILILDEGLHHKIDFAASYKFVGLPVGITMLVLTGGYLGAVLVARLRRKAN